MTWAAGATTVIIVVALSYVAYGRRLVSRSRVEMRRRLDQLVGTRVALAIPLGRSMLQGIEGFVEAVDERDVGAQGP